MSDTPWDDMMSADEKLEWLHDTVEELIEINNRNVSIRKTQHAEIMERLSAVERDMKNTPRRG